VSAPDASVVLSVRGVSKAFGGTQALDRVSVELQRGTIHALLGGNGSGKSTLIKILGGIHAADAGEIGIGDGVYDATSFTPARARALGLSFVHQQQSTFPELTVTENLAIGHGFQTDAAGRVRWRAMRRHAAQVLERFNVDAAPDTPLDRLRPATRTMVAIARALQDRERAHDGVLVLDEPTASLPGDDVELLLTALRRYAESGQTILYVTHRLEEVTQVADRATVLRDGQLVGSVEREQIDHEKLVELIMGRRLRSMDVRTDTRTAADPLLEVRDLAGGAARGVSLAVHPGEIVGLAGLLGSGRSTVLRLLFGASAVESGEIDLYGRPIRLTDPHHAKSVGIAYVPEDRGQAVFGNLSVTENLGVICAGSYYRGGRFHHREERQDTGELLSLYSIKAGSPKAQVSSLSGGNQQKLVLARWLREAPRVLLLDEPTQGVDVGSRLEIWELVRQAVDAGAGALVVTSDFEELPRVCDRALVMRRGRITRELAGEDLREDLLDQLTLTDRAA
jgi:ribose transport system ATP-binding protein